MSLQAVFLFFSISLGIAGGFLSKYFDAKIIADKSPVLLSILLAAILVRLARGMPTFPFEKISQSRSASIIAALDHLRLMYRHAFWSFGIALVCSLAFSALWDNFIASAHSYLAGILVCVLSWALTTAYMLYRTDLLLFKAQSDAIEEVVGDLAATSAAQSIETVRENLRRP